VKRRKRASVDWARLNYILLPDGKPARDRARTSAVGQGFGPIYGIYAALTEEGRVAFVVTMIVAVAALDVRHSDVYVLFCILAGLVFVSLAVSRAMQLPRVTLDVVAPRRVTVGELITFVLVCTNGGDAPRFGLRLRGPFLPWDGRWLTPRPTLATLAVGATERTIVQARFTRRGEHHLDPFSVAPLVPLGLALGRHVDSSGVLFLAVPPVANVTQIQTPAGRRHQPGGVALASKTGESMDLHGVRPYRPGDPVRDLHARSWGRTGVPVVREYQEEYFGRVGVVVDTDRHAADEATLEAALSLAAGVVARLSRGEALIDLIVVGDVVHGLTVGRSLGFLEQALDHLAAVEPSDAPDPEVVLKRLGPHLPRLSFVIVVALAWDAPRRALEERIRSHGVGCTTVLVSADDVLAAPAAKAGGVARVSPRAIMAGEPIAL
jgi:uncharacterized protein (DUF58 family)